MYSPFEEYNSSGESTLATPVSEDRDHLLGPRTAAVTLVEYGDYECPYCRQAHFVLQDLMSGMEGQVRLCFRNFPLTQIHPHARRAAEAAECAAAQGYFWPMHDTLYERQNALEDEDLIGYALELGLDVERFQLDLVQDKFAGRLRQDFLDGVRSGVNGTPAFFINGYRHDGAWDLQSLANAIASAANHQTSEILSRPDRPGHHRHL